MATVERVKIPCAAPRTCGVRWHWSDTTPPCKAVAASTRKPLDTLVAPRAYGTAQDDEEERPDFAPQVLTLNLDDESWNALSQASAAVHGLHVNRHALVEVVERITAGEALGTDTSLDPEVALAYEVLCIDEEVRNAVARAVLGNGADDDEAGVVAKYLEGLLAQSHGASHANEDAPSLDAFPYTKTRIAGLLDAAFEAQRKYHAFDAMTDDMTKNLYAEYTERVGKKWIVRGNSVIEFNAKDVRNGDIITTMTERKGGYSAEAAKQELSAAEWERAKAETPDEAISIPLDDLRAEARRRDIDLERFLDEATTEVKIMVRTQDEVAVSDDGDTFATSVDATTKSVGVADYRAGVAKNGSHYYVPDTSEMSRERAFATIVRARVRADRRRNEASEIAQTLHAAIRRVEAVAVNQTIRYEDTDREFRFQTNNKSNFNRDAFTTVYPEVEEAARTARRDSGNFTPPQSVVESVLLGRTDDARSDDELRAALLGPSSSTPTIMVAQANDIGKVSNVRPSALGKASAAEKIARGVALNGRVLTESFDDAEA